MHTSTKHVHNTHTKAQSRIHRHADANLNTHIPVAHSADRFACSPKALNELNGMRIIDKIPERSVSPVYMCVYHNIILKKIVYRRT